MTKTFFKLFTLAIFISVPSLQANAYSYRYAMSIKASTLLKVDIKGSKSLVLLKNEGIINRPNPIVALSFDVRDSNTYRALLSVRNKVGSKVGFWVKCTSNRSVAFRDIDYIIVGGLCVITKVTGQASVKPKPKTKPPIQKELHRAYTKQWRVKMENLHKALLGRIMSASEFAKYKSMALAGISDVNIRNYIKNQAFLEKRRNVNQAVSPQPKLPIKQPVVNPIKQPITQSVKPSAKQPGFGAYNYGGPARLNLVY